MTAATAVVAVTAVSAVLVTNFVLSWSERKPQFFLGIQHVSEVRSTCVRACEISNLVVHLSFYAFILSFHFILSSDTRWFPNGEHV